jgi:hypothetical protein
LAFSAHYFTTAGAVRQPRPANFTASLQGRAPLCNCTNLSRCFSADSTLVPEPRTLYDYGTAWLWAAAADDVTDDVDKDGLYNAFVHLGLI